MDVVLVFRFRDGGVLYMVFFSCIELNEFYFISVGEAPRPSMTRGGIRLVPLCFLANLIRYGAAWSQRTKDCAMYPKREYR